MRRINSFIKFKKIFFSQMNKRIIVFLFLLVLNTSLRAQQIDTTEFPSQLIENLAEQIVENSEEEEVNLDEITDDLTSIYENKINLNSASFSDLARLHFLSDEQIRALLSYRKKYGQIVSLGELTVIQGFTPDVINNLLPFITIAKEEKIQPLKLDFVLYRGRSEVFLRDKFILEPQKGYIIRDTISPDDTTTNRYLGNKHKIYLRYKFTYRDRVMAGFTAEKDAGEQFFGKTQPYGFDFYSLHLQINQLNKRIYRLVGGDFQAQFGQGLVLWNGFAMGKSAYVLEIRRRPRGLRKYSSTDETHFFRGIGLSVNYGKWYISPFASYKKIDGSIRLYEDTTETDFEQYITSLEGTGYHRTLSEVGRKHTVGETVLGLDISYKGEKIHYGITGIGYHYSVPVELGSALYQQYNFTGQTGANIGGNWFYIWRDISSFGEIAFSSNGGKAMVSGLTLPLHYRLQMVMLYRYYSPNYFYYYGSGFGERSSSRNEQGFYTGLQILPFPKWKISLFFDRYFFPAFSYRIYQPAVSGNELFTQIDFFPRRSMRMYVRYKTEVKPLNLSQTQIYQVEMTKKWYLRYNFTYSVTDEVRLNTRIEMSYYRILDQIDRGFLVMQDIRWNPSFSSLVVYWRFAMFDAPYNARFFAYENDVLYAFSVPAYFYQGYRTYLLVRYDLMDNLSFWIKLSSTVYTDRDVISAGSLNEISGNHKSEIKVQLRYRF